MRILLIIIIISILFVFIRVALLQDNQKPVKIIDKNVEKNLQIKKKVNKTVRDNYYEVIIERKDQL